MFCIQCGAAIFSDARFCVACGTIATIPHSEKVLQGNADLQAAGSSTSPAAIPLSALGGSPLSNTNVGNRALGVLGRALAAGIFVMGVLWIVGPFVKGHATYGAAHQIIQRELRSPSSFAVVAENKVWSGKDLAGRDAYIVRVQYDAANAFGAALRDCKFVAYTMTGDHISWNPLAATIMDCEEMGIDSPVSNEMVSEIRELNFEK